MSSETPCVHETLTHTDGALATWAGLKIDRKISLSNFHGSAPWIQFILGPGAASWIQFTLDPCYHECRSVALVSQLADGAFLQLA